MAQPLHSVQLVLDLLLAERGQQLGHFESLDTKAGIVLGFSGLLMTLTPQLPLGG